MKKLLTLLALVAIVVLIGTYNTAQAVPAQKVPVCHIDPDDLEEPHVIVVSGISVPAHVAHGDYVDTWDPVGAYCDPGYTPE